MTIRYRNVGVVRLSRSLKQINVINARAKATDKYCGNCAPGLSKPACLQHERCCAAVRRRNPARPFLKGRNMSIAFSKPKFRNLESCSSSSSCSSSVHWDSMTAKRPMPCNSFVPLVCLRNHRDSRGRRRARLLKFGNLGYWAFRKALRLGATDSRRKPLPRVSSRREHLLLLLAEG